MSLVLAGLACALIALVVVAVLGLGVLILSLFLPVRRRMDAGGRVLDGITPADLPIWIDRAEQLLADQAAETAAGQWMLNLDGADVPDDLRELGIQGITVMQAQGFELGQVSFVWVGGIDHTELRVQRRPEGGHRVTAQYNDYRSKTLWPPIEADAGSTAPMPATETDASASIVDD